MDICTIVAKNYIAQARVLARSFAEHHPDGHCSVLVIDDFDGYLDPSSEPFEIITPGQIGCVEFEEMALRYDVLELSTAVKPWLLTFLLDRGAEAITYLDPDIRVYSSLERLDRLAQGHGVVLTPHNTVPLPDDGKRPNQIDILLAGVHNLGYVSLGARAEVETLLGWWRERLLNDCRVDPLNGYFVDQRWFDLAPGLVSDHVIMREPQFNIAYWNLHSRRLECAEEGYTVDGKPLAFFHFSGFDSQRPDVLSRHQSRVTVTAGSALARICAEYAEATIESGYLEARSWPYTYHELPSGAHFSARLRKLYQVAAERQEVNDSPFTESGCASFMTWLAQPAPGAPGGVNRLLAEVYGTRSDLQEAFPDVGGGDRAAFLSWAGEAGEQEEPALALLAQPTSPTEVPSPSVLSGSAPGVPTAHRPVEVREHAVRLEDAAVPWGVNVVGYFRSELGVGEAARQVVSALDAGGIPLLPVHGRTIPPNRQGHVYTYLDFTDARYPVNLICMNADVLGEFAEQAGPGFFEGRYSIGMWFWEVERFPEVWTSAFEHVDELWLPTEHVVNAIRPLATVPVSKVTLPVHMPTVLPASRAELDLPEGFMFLFSFDYNSVFERKNPLAVIRAYTRSFSSDDGAVLVLKSINAPNAPADHARLLAAADGRPDIHIIDGYVSAERRDQIVAACDVYVSLHRAEGFGLTMAEAMYLGKPVVATGYSGNLDFMTAENSFLVDYDLVPIGPDSPPYPSGGRWAEPDVDHAAGLMREAFDSPGQASERGRRAAEEIRRTHSPAAAAEAMVQRLDLLREHHHERLRSASLPVSLGAHVEQRAGAGPPVSAPSRLGRLGVLYRRLLLRILKPFTAHQRQLDLELAGSLRSVENKLARLEARSEDRHAQYLAEQRRDSNHPIWERIAALTRSTVALEAATGSLQEAVGDLPVLSERLEELARTIQHIEWEGHAIPYMEGAPFAELGHADVGVVQGYRGLGGDSGEIYRSFEDTFRGSEDFIRDRQRVFLALIGDRAPVLDLGCGRGEFLDLLADEEIPYLGVDSDEGMVRRCHEKGHDSVVLGDGLDYLEKLEDGSLGAVFCAQVIEHLPFDALLRLFALARRKLDSDGIFIAETVNPHSAAALKTFWVDPTHQHPIFPEVALALGRSSGFASAFVFHPNGSGDVGRDRFTQGEYALVAGSDTLLRRATQDEARGPARATERPAASSR